MSTTTTTRFESRGEFELWDFLPVEIRRIILGFGTWDSGLRTDPSRTKVEPIGGVSVVHRLERYCGISLFSRLLGTSIRKDPDSYFHTGLVRCFITESSPGVSLYRKIHPNDETYKRSLRPESRVFRCKQDESQYRLWTLFTSIISRSKRNPVSIALEGTRWLPLNPGIESVRVDENELSEDAFSKAYDQEVRSVQNRDCGTHFFNLELVGLRTDPYEDAGTWDYGVKIDRNGQQFLCSETDSECTYDDLGSLYNGSDGESGSDDGPGDDDSDSGYETEYDANGERIHSIRLASYAKKDKIKYPSRQPVFNRLNTRIPNRHLKTRSGRTVREPLSWRFSIEPKWVGRVGSRYGNSTLGSGLVIGNRLRVLQQIAPYMCHGENWVPYTCRRSNVEVKLSSQLTQYYYVGIEPPLYPQPSFVSIIKKNGMDGALFPLMVEYHPGCSCKRLLISHFSLLGGLNKTAVDRGTSSVASHIRLFTSSSDGLYI